MKPDNAPPENHARRKFIQQSTALASWSLLASSSLFANSSMETPMKFIPKNIKIVDVSSDFEREPLATPYGFKGGYMTNVWQVITRMQDESGVSKIGLGTQNTLWSDAKVFTMHSENAGNALMYAMTERALQMVKGSSFTDPVSLLDEVLEEVYAYGKKITRNPDLRKTFALNALVGFDNAAWLLYAHANSLRNFDDLIPEAYRPGMSARHDKVVSVPSFSFATPVSQMKKLADEGYFFMKIKLGHPGSQQEMLEKDMTKLTEIHQAIGQGKTPHTSSGKIPYYFDMNGRYEHKDSLSRLLDHASKIGAYDQIVVVEEPFPEEYRVDVSEFEARLVSDESAHTDKDAEERIQMGYKGIALKPIAKTLSMTLKIAQLAYEKNIPCLCADLTVNPILVEWNKNVAARLPALPGFTGMGAMENNGHQNYRNWQQMMSYHPYPEAEWVPAKDGLFHTGRDFYEKSGGIFQQPEHYVKLFQV
ncbi:MAG: L-alanine-DL-glutamate epimerase [Cyclobacteriaceae bacterium]